jgi:hypothetical protein
MVPPMADVIEFPKRQRYDVTEDLTESIAELCHGLDAVVVIPALTAIFIEVVAQCIKPEGHTEVLQALAKIIKDGIALCGEGDDEVTRNH